MLRRADDWFVTGGVVQFRDTEVSAPPPPGMPEGRYVDLPGRGTTWVYDTGEQRNDGRPDDRPTLMLLHGWTATAALNWFASFAPLSQDHRVIALDHRGHGRGLRTWRRFRLEDCADDTVALADWLGVDRFTPVGYSMGGPIAQLLWRRHRERLDGMVLCATSRSFRGSSAEWALFAALTGLSVAARMTPTGVRNSVRERMFSGRFDGTDIGQWAQSEVLRNDPRVMAEAGQAIGNFTSHDWIGAVDVPTAVVVTELDPVVPVYRQRMLADSIAGSTVHPVAGDHSVCASDPDRFMPALLDACASVTARAERRDRPTG